MTTCRKRLVAQLSTGSTEEKPVQLVNFPREDPTGLRKPEEFNSLAPQNPTVMEVVDPRYEKHCVDATIVRLIRLTVL